ncbi:MAG: hypothetical protein J7L14_02670 [Candidatus Diapherotrites archaeon]|nr:hypothetical protein [Candidatus Diapherotrites archaeon]
MSLITLTFAKKDCYIAKEHTLIVKPGQNLRNSSERAVVKITKVCSFYNVEEPYLLGEVVSGVLSEDMVAEINGKLVRIETMDSKYEGVAKEGMRVGIMLTGIKSEEIPKEGVLEFGKLGKE